MSEATLQQMIAVEVPEYSFELMPDENGEPYIVSMTIRTSGTEFRSFLCKPNPADIEVVARAFNRELLKLSTAIKRQGKRIQPVTGVNSDALRTEKGREQRSTRRTRP